MLQFQQYVFQAVVEALAIAVLRLPGSTNSLPRTGYADYSGQPASKAKGNCRGKVSRKPPQFQSCESAIGQHR